MSKFFNYEITQRDYVVRVIPHYPYLDVLFADETHAVFDLQKLFDKGIFFPVIKDKKMFDRVGAVDGIVMWPWGLDLASDRLYAEACNHPSENVITLG